LAQDADVIVIGAGAGGPVVAKELGEKGIKVLLLEAGPWYGNKNWPRPNSKKGSVSSCSVDDLSKDILTKCFTNLEGDMNDFITGKFRWGPADRSRPPWIRNIPQGGFVWQISGVGGTTLPYLANTARAYPMAVEGIWPISYREMIPYYEKVEELLSVSPAPMTGKEELFFYGAKKAGYSLLKTLNVTSPGYRPQPNAIISPNENIKNQNFKLSDHTEGCTLCGNCINGCKTGPSVEKTAKRSTLVSYVPLALNTGNVKIRPNTFVTKVLTESKKDHRAIGVKYRDTWTGETGEIRGKVVVMAAGSIETPRLWLNSQLPSNSWVGKGLTSHWLECVSGIFDEKVLLNILGAAGAKPYIGQNSASRFDYPGVGAMLQFGASPGLFSTLIYSFSKNGYHFLNSSNKRAPWHIRGNIVGQELKELMMEYENTLSVLIITNDEVNPKNGVTLHSIIKDEHGLIPTIKYYPGKKDSLNRDQLAVIAADIFRKAGAKKIIRTDCSPGLLAHIQGTMRMGYVVDSNCESFMVKRLFIADNSILHNSLGGSSPTLTTQAMATRTAEKLADKYFN
jgi:choline dehydrogenase-like flavoprotein